MYEQQSAARTALHVVGTQRDRLSTQKEALRVRRAGGAGGAPNPHTLSLLRVPQAELLEARRARDGFLADRTALMGALSACAPRARPSSRPTRTSRGASRATPSRSRARWSARSPRWATCTARSTRKRQISSFNEQAADIFLDGMTGQLRGLLEAVFAFRDGQSERHAAAVASLAELDLEREAHSATVAADVRKLSHATVDVLTGPRRDGLVGRDRRQGALAAPARGRAVRRRRRQSP